MIKMAIKDNYKNIDDSFATGFENNSHKELVYRHKTLDNQLGRQDIRLEMNRRLITEIEDFNKSSSKQTREMINLTKWIIGLTIVMLFGLGIQIGLILFS
jgi:hypothetical protein